MATNRVKITRAVVAKATAPEGTNPKAGHAIQDVEVSALRLVVYPSGRKAWRMYYRAPDGRQRRPVLGDATTIAPDEARRIAREWLVSLAHGDDPQANREEHRGASTVADLVKRYRSDCLPRKKPTSQRSDEAMLDRFILPKLGSRLVKDLSFEDVAALHKRLGDTPYQANRVLALVSRLVSFAEQLGWREQGRNPARRVKKYPEKARHNPLSEVDLVRLGEALAGMERDGWSAHAVGAIRLLAVTGLRRSEMLSARWTDIDLDRGVLQLSDSKTGPRRVPLGPVAVDLLRGLKRDDENVHVFPGRVPGAHLVDLQKPWREARRRAGLALRLHDLRHGVASAGLGEGLTLAEVARVLGHASEKTAHRYAELLDDPARAAATRAAAPIARALDIGARRARREGGAR